MECKQLLINSIKEQMRVDSTAYEFENRKSVVLVIGVNGVGKTTSVGKLAGKLKDQGKKVILAAADTFRAAAGEQLDRVGIRVQDVDIIGGQEGADPASIVYDAVAAAKAQKCGCTDLRYSRTSPQQEKSDGGTSQDLSHSLRENIRKLIVKHLLFWMERQDRMHCAQAKQFAEVADVTWYYPYKTGRNSQRAELQLQSSPSSIFR